MHLAAQHLCWACYASKRRRSGFASYFTAAAAARALNQYWPVWQAQYNAKRAAEAQATELLDQRWAQYWRYAGVAS